MSPTQPQPSERRGAPVLEAAVFRLAPPYAREAGLGSVPVGGARDGTVLILEPRAGVDPAGLRRAIGRLRWQGYPVILRASRRALSDRPGLLAAVAASGAYVAPRSVLLNREGLRRVLHGRIDLADHWIGWVRLGTSVPRRLEGPLRSIIEGAPRGTRLGELSEGGDWSARTLRRNLRERSLPPARAWWQGARLLHVQLELIRDPDLRPGDVAGTLGYANADTLSNRMHQEFGITARRCAELLGLEWRYRAWWFRRARGEADQWQRQLDQP